MKALLLLPVILALALRASGLEHGRSGSSSSWRLRRQLNSASEADSFDKDSFDEDMYGQIYSDDSDTSACIEVKNGEVRKGNKLIIGDCSGIGKRDSWRGDRDGLLHTALDDNYCVQAGHGGAAKASEFIRLYRCDPSNVLQQFVFINGGGIRPKYYPELCVVWRGVTANVGSDPLILKLCNEVDDRNDWSNDPFPDRADETNGERSPCVGRDVPEFIIDDNVDIGDTLIRPGPAFALKCGSDCYTVKDNGDDPPYDPELGDTLRFAYKEVASMNFFIQSRVCGVDCDSGGEQYGRTGLMVRDSLDPLARNVFVSHSPNGQADWSYRSVVGGEMISGFHGSPDVPCLWITLQRAGNEFSFTYAYDGISECDKDPIMDLDQTITLEMPTTVYVGLAVSTGVSPPFCRYTEADFNEIECRGCFS